MARESVIMMRAKRKLADEREAKGKSYDREQAMMYCEHCDVTAAYPAGSVLCVICKHGMKLETL